MFAIKCFRVALLGLSFLGYLLYFGKEKLKIELVPGVVFSAIGMLIFFAGILNLLREMSVLLLAVGLFLFVYMLKQGIQIKSFITPGTVFLACSFLFSVYLLYGSKFNNYDNFSHWAIVEKLLIQRNRFPIWTDRNIGFQSYPLGSSSFIYYCVYLSGVRSEWTQMLFQALFMSGVLISLYAFSSRIEEHIFVTASILVLVCSNTSLIDLYVDTLLPVTAIGAFAFCFYYQSQNKLAEKAVYLLPYLCFLVAVKNSGLLFSVAVLVYLIAKLYKNRCAYRRLLILLLAPFISLLLWQRHVSLVFSSGLKSKHSMSLTNFKTVIGSKSFDTVSTITKDILTKTFSFSNRALLLLLILFLLWAIWDRRKNSLLFDGLSVGALLYISYQVGLLCMYLFSMPGSEATRLAEYSRYHRTAVIFLGGIADVSALSVKKGLFNKRAYASGALVVTMFCSIWALKPNFTYLKRQNYTGTPREHFDTLIREYKIDSGLRYLIVTENTNGLYNYMAKYLLDPQTVASCSAQKLKEESIWKDYDILLCIDYDEPTKTILKEIFDTEIPVIPLETYVDSST